MCVTHAWKRAHSSGQQSMPIHVLLQIKSEICVDQFHFLTPLLLRLHRLWGIHLDDVWADAVCGSARSPLLHPFTVSVFNFVPGDEILPSIAVRAWERNACTLMWMCHTQILVREWAIYANSCLTLGQEKKEGWLGGGDGDSDSSLLRKRALDILYSCPHRLYSLSFYLSFFYFLSFFLFLSIFLSFSFYLSFFFFLSFFLFLSIFLSFSLSLSFSLFLFLSFSFLFSPLSALTA